MIFYFSYLLGYLSDKFGRRPLLLAIGFGTSIMTTLFGLTNTTLGLTWAIFCRIFTGFLNSKPRLCIYIEHFVFIGYLLFGY